MRRALIVLLLAMLSTSVLAQSRVTLSLGHAGAVRDAASHPTEQVAFTVGDDGRLLVWDLERQALRFRYQVTQKPVLKVLHHPTENEVALLVGEGVDRSSIRVIEWETGEEVFRRDVDGIPVHISYSPAGSYIIYSLPSFQSLHFLSADRGSPRAYLDNGFGIVNFVQMGRSERNIMTYVPTRGQFIYWSLQSGEELQRVATRERLSHLVLIDPENRRAIAAAGDGQLVVVDNLTGETRATYPISPIHDIRFDPNRGRILVLTDQAGSRELMSFTYADGRLRREFFRPSGMSDNTELVVPLVDAANAVLGGDARGVVSLYSDTTGRRTDIGPRPTVPVVDVAFTEGRLHLSLGDHVVTFVSDALQSGARNLQATSIRQSSTQLPGMTSARLERVGEKVLVWGESQTPGTVFALAPPSVTIEPFYTDEGQNPVREVRATDGGPIVIHRDGRIVQLLPTLAIQRFQYVARGAQTATWAAEVGLVAAKTRSSDFDSSLIRVDQVTGETVRIRSDAFLTTGVTIGSRSNIYAVGLHGSPASASTRLIRFSGDTHETATVLSEFNGEDSNADLVWDDRSGALFTTIGFRGLVRFDGRSQTALDATGQIARRVALGGMFIAAVNADGSVSIWLRDTGEFLFDVYLFENDQWIAIAANGAFLSGSGSRPAERYLDFIPAPRTRLNLEDFRIPLPYRE